MSGFVCPHCGKEIDLFKSGGGEKIAREYNIPLLGRIPIDPKIVDSGDKGQLAAFLSEGAPAAKVFEDIVEKIIKI